MGHREGRGEPSVLRTDNLRMDSRRSLPQKDALTHFTNRQATYANDKGYSVWKTSCISEDGKLEVFCIRIFSLRPLRPYTRKTLLNRFRDSLSVWRGAHSCPQEKRESPPLKSHPLRNKSGQKLSAILTSIKSQIANDCSKLGR